MNNDNALRRFLSPLEHFPASDLLDVFNSYYERSNLTKSQLFFWLEQCLFPHVSLHQLMFIVTISGQVQVDCFRAAFQALVDGTDALRIVIHVVNGIPLQSVVPSVSYSLAFIDCTAEYSPGADAGGWLGEHNVTPFNVEHSLFDSALVKIADETFVWYFRHHVLIADACSHALLYRRLADLYMRALHDRLGGEVPKYPRFQEYVTYERTSRRSQSDPHVHEYWQKLSARSELTRFYGRLPAVGHMQSVRISYTIDVGRAKKLRAIASALVAQGQIPGVTVDMALCYVFTTLLFALLSRISENQRLVIGVSFHNRPAETSQNTVGMFTEVYPVSVEVKDDTTFLSLMDQVAAELHMLLQHRPNMPIHSLPRRWNDVLLNYVKMSITEFAGMPARFVQTSTGYNNGSLALVVQDGDDEDAMLLSFYLNDDLFSEELQGYVVPHLQVLLESFLNDCRQNIAQVDLLSEGEKQLLQVALNQTETVFPREQTLVSLFEVQARRHPRQPAAISGTQVLTYAELNARANQLAHYLRQLGVGPEVKVGICMERSLEMIVGKLGIMKAGAAYVPLDPAYPQERLAFMLQDAGVDLLLTQAQLLKTLPATGRRKLCLDSDCHSIAEHSSENPIGLVRAEHLAYVIYTSGSTGNPKGILINHYGIVNNITDLNRRFAVGCNDRVLCLSSLSFDMCVYEIMGMLTAGGTAVLPDMGRAQDPGHWADLVMRHQVTVWNSAPSLLSMFVEYVTAHPDVSPCSLRLVLLGGDWIPVTLPDTLKALVPGITVISLGGATEASIHSTIYPVETTDPTWKSIPYGRPMANQTAYILDGYGHIVPIGYPGELHLGGVGLARGYVGQPALTAERFIPDPFSTTPGARLYRTGDLACYLPDGTIELLGRIDHQVKIRGFRIELGEIEMALRRHPTVQEAVVLARADKQNQKRLVCYLVLKPDALLNKNELRTFLRKTLPDYMVPSHFMLLETLPLTPNGKIDRRSLPVPDMVQSEEELFVPPQTAGEVVLARIWADVLGCELVGLYDNFFELGGHSLGAAQIVARIRDTFHLELSPRDLFEHPTVFLLTRHIEAVGRAKGIEVEKIAEIHIHLSQLSEDEVKTLLAELGE